MIALNIYDTRYIWTKNISGMNHQKIFWMTRSECASSILQKLKKDSFKSFIKTCNHSDLIFGIDAFFSWCFFWKPMMLIGCCHVHHHHYRHHCHSSSSSARKCRSVLKSNNGWCCHVYSLNMPITIMFWYWLHACHHHHKSSSSSSSGSILLLNIISRPD